MEVKNFVCTMNQKMTAIFFIKVINKVCSDNFHDKDLQTQYQDVLSNKSIGYFKDKNEHMLNTDLLTHNFVLIIISFTERAKLLYRVSNPAV